MSDSKLSVRPYKGTRDFYPEEMRVRNWFFNRIRQLLQLCAYEEYNGPMLESLDIYAAKSGREIAEEQTYHFEDKGGRVLAVRPEMTPTVARMVAAKVNQLEMPLRWFSIPNLYRYERPQRGRLREHWQVNVDIFGCNSYEADLEIIQTAILLLKSFEADEKMFQVHINNRRFFNDVLAAICGLDREKAVSVSKVVDRRGKVEPDVYRQQLLENGLNEGQMDTLDSLYSMNVETAVRFCPDSQGAKELQSLFRGIAALGLDRYCQFDFGIVRGLDYYTGTVFEVFDEAPENNRAMFGGGRYDNLVDLFVKNANIPGVGFGFGDVTLENFLVTHQLLRHVDPTRIKVLIARFPDIPFEQYKKVSDILRESGVVNSVYLGSKKIGKQIEYADKEGYTHLVIMGDREVAEQKVLIRDLASRSEQECPLAGLPQLFV
ncbi:MAG: histidine--tRNA ligase [Thermoguttaceae bacterium]